MADLLTPGTPVLGVLYADLELNAEEYQRQMDLAQGWMDDAYWEKFVHGPFSWQRFLDWFVARRWLVPRDVRRR